MESKEWRLMKTAPVGEHVLVGKWSLVSGSPVWLIDEAVVFKMSWFGLVKSKTFEGEYYTHWAPLPAPPKIITE